MEEINIYEINVITLDVINFFLSNPEIAKEQYYYLINSAKPRGLDKKAVPFYTEEHHICPRCMDGTDEEYNLVLLTYKEHILAHLLLYASNPDVIGLFLSFCFLIDVKEIRHCFDTEIQVDLLVLEEAKIKKSEIMRENNPMKNPETAKKLSEYKKKQEPFFKGKHHTEETKKKLREKTLALNWKGESHPFFGKKHSIESRKKMSDKLRGELHPLYGKHLKDSTKQKLSESHKEPVISPEGIEYPSIRDAAKATGHHRTTLSKWINHMPEKGWKKK